MSYTTVNGTTTSAAQTYASTELVEVKADVLLRNAERRVKRVAPPPSEVSSEYNAAAADTEMRIFELLASMPVLPVKSESVGDISISYGDQTMTVDEVVASEMADWIDTSTSDDGPGTVSFASVEWY